MASEDLYEGTIRISTMSTRHLADVMRIEGDSMNPQGSEALWAKELTTPASRNLVAVTETGCVETVVGFINFWVVAGEVQLNGIAVKREFRRLGIGDRLLAAMAGMAVREGAIAATLEVRASNSAAIKLYEKNGFVVKGRRLKYYDDGDDALIMWRTYQS